MEKTRNKKVGRPPLKIDSKKLQEELKKYINQEQSGVATYTNLGIGKTSFYDMIKKKGVKIS